MTVQWLAPAPLGATSSMAAALRAPLARARRVAPLGAVLVTVLVAHVAVAPYKRKPLEPGQLNRELGVCYALEGSVRRNGNQVLITAQLGDALSGLLLWSDSYVGEFKDIFRLRNEITRVSPASWQ